MREIGELYSLHNKAKKDRHREAHRANTDILVKSRLKYIIASYECYLFRDDKISIDFYPSTGRWKDNKTGRMFKGGSHNLIGWLANKRKVKNE